MPKNKQAQELAIRLAADATGCSRLTQGDARPKAASPDTAGFAVRATVLAYESRVFDRADALH